MGTFRTADEAARAYAAAVWRFGCTESKINFPDVESAEEAQFLVPHPLIETHEDQCNHERAVRRSFVSEADERMMAEHWRLHPEDVAREEEFWAQKKHEKEGGARREEEEEGID
jgi:hypothetical protein